MIANATRNWKTMASRFISAVVVILLLSYCSFSIYKSNVASAEAKAARKQAAIAADVAIKHMVSKDQADSAWLKHLDSDSMSPILTAELQRVWVTGAPILFEGKLNDISRNSDGSYEIFVEYTSDNGRPHFFSSTLQLRVECEESKGNALLEWVKKNPAILYNKVALTAAVASVDSAVIAGSDGETVPIQVGRGRCLTLVPIPENVRD